MAGLIILSSKFLRSLHWCLECKNNIRHIFLISPWSGCFKFMPVDNSSYLLFCQVLTQQPAQLSHSKYPIRVQRLSWKFTEEFLSGKHFSRILSIIPWYNIWKSTIFMQREISSVCWTIANSSAASILYTFYKINSGTVGEHTDPIFHWFLY